MTSYRQQILAEIRDGKRSWSYAPSGDYEVFRTRVVEPLRQLKYDGVIQALSEIESRDNGTTRVIAVQIIGAVDAAATKGQE
jgi:VCBS repeat-containing protein